MGPSLMPRKALRDRLLCIPLRRKTRYRIMGMEGQYRRVYGDFSVTQDLRQRDCPWLSTPLAAIDLAEYFT
jgi:hypothetical protein